MPMRSELTSTHGKDKDNQCSVIKAVLLLLGVNERDSLHQQSSTGRNHT